VLFSNYFILTRRNPYTVILNTTQVWAVAFGTSSSAATLPVTIRNAENNLKITPQIANFVCTTGATVNMDAGALAYSITAIFMIKVMGFQLTAANVVLTVLVSTLISIGAAALPSAGLVNYMAVMSALGLPVDKALSILSPILSVDWLEDRIMTMVNIEGDLFGAAVINHYDYRV